MAAIILSNLFIEQLGSLIDINPAKVSRIVIDATVNEPLRITIEEFGTEITIAAFDESSSEDIKATIDASRDK